MALRAKCRSIYILEENALKCIKIILDLYFISQKGVGGGGGQPKGRHLTEDLFGIRCGQIIVIEIFWFSSASLIQLK